MPKLTHLCVVVALLLQCSTDYKSCMFYQHCCLLWQLISSVGQNKRNETPKLPYIWLVKYSATVKQFSSIVLLSCAAHRRPKCTFYTVFERMYYQRLWHVFLCLIIYCNCLQLYAMWVLKVVVIFSFLLFTVVKIRYVTFQLVYFVFIRRYPYVYGRDTQSYLSAVPCAVVEWRHLHL